MIYIYLFSKSCNGVQSKFNITLPVFINKFFESTQMDSQSFFGRWKNLAAPGQEQQKIFKASFPIEKPKTNQKVKYEIKHWF